jgi:hypothetical protein
MAEDSCSHLNAITEVKRPTRRECEECVKIGASWVHLAIVALQTRRTLVELLKIASPCFSFDIATHDFTSDKCLFLFDAGYTIDHNAKNNAVRRGGVLNDS